MQQIEHLFPSSWLAFLSDDSPVIQQLNQAWQHLTSLQKSYPHKKICPDEHLIFKAFEYVSPNQLRVVLLGQDPYHGSGQAQGLSFSVPQTFKIPPSLRTIYKELDQSVSTFEVPLHGDLTHWAQQGVLLLNAILTVFESEPASHRKVGWQGFTDQLIQELSDRMDGLVFLLWGNFAKKRQP